MVRPRESLLVMDVVVGRFPWTKCLTSVPDTLPSFLWMGRFRTVGGCSTAMRVAVYSTTATHLHQQNDRYCFIRVDVGCGRSVRLSRFNATKQLHTTMPK
jgi:hypothetical protein